jgi:2-dehydro-3-deoxy-D-arabinonate dehydratase
MIRIYHTEAGPVAEHGGAYHPLPGTTLEALLREPSPAASAARLLESAGTGAARDAPGALLPPVAGQEVWAAGVTYLRSRTARMEESKVAGGGSFYDRVYEAERPELFFKAAAWRVVGPGGAVRIRRDSRWNVPEPELALVVGPAGRIAGYTIGNDMSSRDIEGENPLYLPQAKVYDGSCALGPCLLLSDEPLPPSTTISMEIRRSGATAFEGATTLDRMKRSPAELVEHLYRELTFPHGCILLTGTGVVPPDDFTLRPEDEVRITIEGIGTLVNYVG